MIAKETCRYESENSRVLSTKANRKREEKKKNLRKAFDYTILGLIALAIVVWIGWSAYDMYESKRPRAVAEVDYSAVSDYIQSLNTAE